MVLVGVSLSVSDAPACLPSYTYNLYHLIAEVLGGETRGHALLPCAPFTAHHLRLTVSRTDLSAWQQSRRWW
jgi:hypothetical protein